MDITFLKDEFAFLQAIVLIQRNGYSADLRQVQASTSDILVNCADEVPPVRLYGFLANETSLLSE